MSERKRQVFYLLTARSWRWRSRVGGGGRRRRGVGVPVGRWIDAIIQSRNEVRAVGVDVGIYLFEKSEVDVAFQRDDLTVVA